MKTRSKRIKALAEMKRRLENDASVEQRTLDMISSMVVSSGVEHDAHMEEFDDFLVRMIANSEDGAHEKALPTYVAMLKASVRPSIDRLVVEGRLVRTTDENGESIVKAAAEEMT